MARAGLVPHLGTMASTTGWTTTQWRSELGKRLQVENSMVGSGTSTQEVTNRAQKYGIQRQRSGKEISVFELHIDETICLKMLQIEDGDALFALIDASRNYLREWLSFVDQTTHVEDTRKFIGSTLEQYASGTGSHLGIWYCDTLVGVVGAGIDQLHKTANVGYWLGEQFQSIGVMTRSCRGFVRYLCEYHGLNRIEIQAAVDNHKSRSIPERLGFHEESCRRQAGYVNNHFLDLVVYVMLAEDWYEYPDQSWHGRKHAERESEREGIDSGNSS